MSYSRIVLFTFFCDRCEEFLDLDNHSTKQQAFAYARNEGWTVGKKVLCPYCNGNKED